MKTKYSAKTTMAAIPEILHFLISELIFMSRERALRAHLPDLRGLITEDVYGQEDVELLRAIDDPIIELALEATDSIWTVYTDFHLINGFEKSSNPENSSAAILANELTFSFLILGDSESTNRKDSLGPSEDFLMYYETAAHVLYETALLLMHGETSMGDPEYASVAWDLGRHELIYSLDRTDKNIELLATLMELMYMWEDRFQELDEGH